MLDVFHVDSHGIYPSAGTRTISLNLMKDGTNKEPLDRLADIDVRPNAGIVRSPLDEITVLERGWFDADNSLLHGPALLVSNDGPFPEKDREALHKAIGGSKEEEVDKIGTFGIGLKSVFHICEAFLYMGSAESKIHAGVLNPWAGTGEGRDTDPLHPDWDVIGGSDPERSGVTNIWTGGRRVADMGWEITARSPTNSALGSVIQLPQRCCWRSVDICRPSKPAEQQGRIIWATASSSCVLPAKHRSGWDGIRT